ncbi:hypothetical protein H0H93_012449 [Arthromyces matolae]|nr:hypothetical protein H0H93_012449 [Arthromyces matolae]
MGLFLPSIVENLGYEDSTAQLYTAPPIAVAFVFTLAVSLLSDKLGKRGFVFIACIIVTTAGVSIFLGSRLDVVRYGSLFLTLSGINAASPTLWTWSVNNVAPYTRRATAISFAAFMSNAGSILGKWLFGPISPGPMYTKGSIIVLTFCVLMVILAGLKIVYFTLENRKKSAIRSVLPRQDEKSELGDRSAWFVYSL